MLYCPAEKEHAVEGIEDLVWDLHGFDEGAGSLAQTLDCLPDRVAVEHNTGSGVHGKPAEVAR